jgi:tRNA nucleotidyltransferase/poly(A) polymerase
MIRIYEVGGCVRDGLLGIPTKDLDYTVEAPSFVAMREWLEAQGFEIFVENPEFLTIRARFPRGKSHFGTRDVRGMTGDFVMARKESTYSDGRHPDQVVPGTLFDDLARRDFTVNAMAISPEGELMDPFNGFKDLELKLLRTVGTPEERFSEDALRALRAIRFSITKGFTMHPAVWDALDSEWLPGLLTSVSVERRREELLRAFHHDTEATLMLLAELPEAFREAVFADGLWLKPTLES